MTRRIFSSTLLVLPGLRGDAGRQVRVQRITLARIEGRFHKFVAMNSYDTAPKGHTYTNTLVRLFTDQGVEGTGVMEYAAPDAAFEQAVRGLLGANPLEIYEPDSRFQPLLKRYPHLDGPLHDLVGKLTGKPCWQLLGGKARDTVEVYDGTLYFSDVWFRDRGVRAVVEEAEEAVKKGYLGLKLKIGRGWKWMDAEAGLARDVEVVRAVRKAAGKHIKLLVDANNGFRDNHEHAWRFLEETADTGLYWLEEPFPEEAAEYARLRDRMHKADLGTYLADGENFTEAAQFEPYLKPKKLLDVVQLDIRRCGLVQNRQLARRAEEVGALSVPHNWGSQVGLLMGRHAAKAMKAVVAAEDDRSTCDAIQAAGYEFRGGMYSVSDAPGLGISVDEKVYAAKYKAAETVITAG